MPDIEKIKNNNIKPIAMYDEMSSSYLSYAMSVIVSRALPDSDTTSSNSDLDDEITF